MDREVLFAKTLEQVRRKAMEQGAMITKNQVEEAFTALQLSTEQLEMVFDYLEKHKIGIGEAADPDEYMSDEDKDYLAEYLEILASIPAVSDGEKEAIILAAMAGEISARNRLVEIFLPEVAEIAKLYSGQGVFLEDLIGQGNMAVSEGVSMLGSQENAREAEGLLGKMIMDAMEEMIEQDLLETEVDRQVVDKINDIADKARDLAAEMRRKVTIAELAEETELSEEEIREAYRISGYAIEDIDGVEDKK